MSSIEVHSGSSGIRSLRSLFGVLSSDLAIDLGMANTLVNARGKGIVVNESSLVAINKNTSEVEAVGKYAKEMLGRTPGDIVAFARFFGRKKPVESLPRAVSLSEDQLQSLRSAGRS